MRIVRACGQIAELTFPAPGPYCFRVGWEQARHRLADAGGVPHRTAVEHRAGQRYAAIIPADATLYGAFRRLLAAEPPAFASAED
jgi:hypothetical protein